MLTLFFAPGSSSMAPHIALHEIGAAFEARPLSFAKQEHRTPEYLSVNPEGKVPTLLVDGRPLTEVAAILFYLAKCFPSAALIPDDLEGEAQAVSWMSFVASTVHAGWIARRANVEETRTAASESATGPSGATLSPTSISSGSTGGFATRSTRRRRSCRTSRRTTTA